MGPLSRNKRLQEQTGHEHNDFCKVEGHKPSTPDLNAGAHDFQQTEEG